MLRHQICALILVLVATVVLAIPPMGSASGAASPPSQAAATGGPTADAGVLIKYQSAVDAWNLSYEEYLPAGFNASVYYPLAVYLGDAGNSTTWVEGGTSGWLGEIGNRTATGEWENGLIANASTFGYILIALNTRSSAGFYANTPCGGPQEQDVVDAIKREEGLRHVAGVYLVGLGAGATGALTTAADHDLLVSGAGVGSLFSDLFELYAYGTAHPGSTAGRLPALIDADNCGVRPSATNGTVDSAFFEHYSTLRFAPANLSGETIWASAGGADDYAPDSPSTWGYLQANNSFFNESCRSATTLGEPSGPSSCTTPRWTLSLANPGRFPSRFVYEENGTHAVEQIDPADMFEFFDGALTSGLFTSSFPPTAFTSVPLPHNSTPSVHATVTPSTAPVGTPIHFSASEVWGGSSPYTFEWIFSDGGTHPSRNVTWTFTRAGDYKETVIVTDASFIRNTSSTTVHIAASPVVTAFPSKGAGEVDRPVHFDPNVQGGFPPYVLNWTFGDGTSATGPEVNHTYAETGTYHVVVNVSDSRGQHVSFDANETIDLPLAANASIGRNITDAGLKIPTEVTAFQGVPPYSVDWYAESDADAHAQLAFAGDTHTLDYTYAQPGDYTSTLNVTDETGATQSFVLKVHVNPRPTASVTSVGNDSIPGESISFYSTLSNGTPPFTAWEWSFGDGANASGPNASHSFQAAGEFEVTFASNDSVGGVAIAFINVTVGNPPGQIIAPAPGSPVEGPASSWGPFGELLFSPLFLVSAFVTGVAVSLRLLLRRPAAGGVRRPPVRPPEGPHLPPP
ncbi:MAG TPA: PKD domain-containing protein [Thermoplasmata archaeon]|nr:PKD domain-containing protein [Thermoplasmata archaeon]